MSDARRFVSVNQIEAKNGPITAQEFRFFMEDIPGLAGLVARHLEISVDQLFVRLQNGKLNFADLQEAIENV